MITINQKNFNEFIENLHKAFNKPDNFRKVKKRFDIYFPPKIIIVDGIKYLQFNPDAWLIMAMPDTTPEPRIVNLKQ